MSSLFSYPEMAAKVKGVDKIFWRPHVGRQFYHKNKASSRKKFIQNYLTINEQLPKAHPAADVKLKEYSDNYMHTFRFLSSKRFYLTYAAGCA